MQCERCVCEFCSLGKLATENSTCCRELKNSVHQPPTSKALRRPFGNSTIGASARLHIYDGAASVVPPGIISSTRIGCFQVLTSSLEGRCHERCRADGWWFRCISRADTVRRGPISVVGTSIASLRLLVKEKRYLTGLVASSKTNLRRRQRQHARNGTKIPPNHPGALLVSSPYNYLKFV